MELPGELSDGQAIATRPPNGTVIVHRNHVLGLRVGESFSVRTFTLTKAATVGPSYALTLPLGGSLLRAQLQSTWMCPKSASRRRPGGWSRGMKVVRTACRC